MSDKQVPFGSEHGQESGSDNTNVFISYCHTDTELVNPVVKLLRVNDSFVFQDIDHIKPGKKWQKALDDALSGSNLVVVFWCDHARVSSEVAKEWKAAIEQRKDVLPLLLDSTPLPDELGEYQWIDFRESLGDVHGKIKQKTPLGIAARLLLAVATIGLSGWLAFSELTKYVDAEVEQAVSNTERTLKVEFDEALALAEQTAENRFALRLESIETFAGMDSEIAEISSKLGLIRSLIAQFESAGIDGSVVEILESEDLQLLESLAEMIAQREAEAAYIAEIEAAASAQPQAGALFSGLLDNRALASGPLSSLNSANLTLLSLIIVVTLFLIIRRFFTKKKESAEKEKTHQTIAKELQSELIRRSSAS